MEILQRKTFYKLLEYYNVKIGVELGVDRGDFSEIINKRFNFETFFSIDRWNDHPPKHTVQHYFKALKRLLKYNVITLRCTFTEAVSLFEDGYFDFIYIDGYAGTGQEDGKTLYDWYPKLKIGGIFSGHDYHPKWQKTIDTVDTFAKQNNKTINLTIEDRYPSWWFIK